VVILDARHLRLLGDGLINIGLAHHGVLARILGPVSVSWGRSCLISCEHLRVVVFGTRLPHGDGIRRGALRSSQVLR